MEPSIPFHSLVNMVDSEDNTLEKIKIQKLSPKINNRSNNFLQNIAVQDSSPEPPQIQGVDPNNKSKPQFEKYCSFCHKNNNSICLKNLNHNLALQLLPFINVLQPSLKNLKILATVVEVLITLTVDLFVTLDIDLVLTRAHILVLDTMINLTLITILLLTTVIDLDMTDNINKTPTNHTLLLHAHIKILHLLEVHLNNIPVLVNDPQVIITPPLSNTTLRTVLLPNHVMIAIVVDHIQIQRTTHNFNKNPLLLLLSHQHRLFKVIFLQNPNLKLI